MVRKTLQLQGYLAARLRGVEIPSLPRGKTLVVFLTTLALLSGCGYATRFAYNQADWLVYRKLDPFLNVNDAQRETYDARFEALWRWHRQSELPLYAAQLEGYARYLDNLPDQIAAGHVEEMAEQLRGLIDRIIERALPDAVAVLRDLSDAQVAQLIEAVGEKDEEFAEEYLDIDDEARVEKYLEWTADRVDKWFGHVTDEQERLLRVWANERHQRPAALKAWRTLRRAHLRHLLASREAPEFPERLRELLAEPRSTQSPELSSVVEQNHALWFQLLADILNTSTAAQRRHARERLLDYAGDFRTLSAQQPD